MFHQSTLYHMAVRSLSIPPVNTVPHGGQIIVYSVSQHYHMGGQIIVYSVSQHCTISRSDHCVFCQSTLYHMEVRSSRIPSVNTALYGGQIIVYYSSQYNTTSSSCIPSVNTVPYRGQIIVYFVSKHCTIWRSDHRVFHLSTQHYMAVRSLCIIPVNTIPHRHRVFRQSTMYHMVVRSCILPARFEVVIVVLSFSFLSKKS